MHLGKQYAVFLVEVKSGDIAVYAGEDLSRLLVVAALAMPAWALGDDKQDNEGDAATCQHVARSCGRRPTRQLVNEPCENPLGVYGRSPFVGWHRRQDLKGYAAGKAPQPPLRTMSA